MRKIQIALGLTTVAKGQGLVQPVRSALFFSNWRDGRADWAPPPKKKKNLEGELKGKKSRSANKRKRARFLFPNFLFFFLRFAGFPTSPHPTSVAQGQAPPACKKSASTKSLSGREKSWISIPASSISPFPFFSVQSPPHHPGDGRGEKNSPKRTRAPRFSGPPPLKH